MVVTWISRKSGRQVDEDAVGKVRVKNILCVAVADGLGGFNGGHIASKLAINAVLEAFSQNPGFSKAHLEKYIESARRSVVDKAMEEPDLFHMLSTIAVLLVKGKRALWANVGDSRIYMFNDELISHVSEDHSVAFLDFVRGNIEYGDIRKSINKNKLTSALGVNMDSVNYSNEVRLDASSAFLLCTNGWWSYITEEDMEETFNKSKTAKEWLENMLKIRDAVAPEKSDDYTAAVVKI